MIAVRDQQLIDEWAWRDELHREQDAVRGEAVHHGARAAYYYATYKGVVLPWQGLPNYSKQTSRLEGVVQLLDRR